jgi:hypothetical protein
MTWVRLLGGLGIVLFGMTALLEPAWTSETPNRRCNGTAIDVAFTGGRGPRDLRDACRGEGRGQVEAGLVVSAVGLVVILERRARTWARGRDAGAPGVSIWRMAAPWRPVAVVTVWGLTLLAAATGGWSVPLWVVGWVIVSPIVVPLTALVIRPRIEARPDRLVIQNAVRGQVATWAEVAGAEPTRRGIEVALRSGRRIRAAAVRVPRRSRNHGPVRADAVVALLRSRAREADHSPRLVFGWGASSPASDGGESSVR